MRAVRCGLDILHRLASLNAQADRTAPLPARLAVHTGRVFVDAVGRGAISETLAMGEVPNVAACVQSVAQFGASNRPMGSRSQGVSISQPISNPSSSATVCLRRITRACPPSTSTSAISGRLL